MTGRGRADGALDRALAAGRLSRNEDDRDQLRILVVNAGSSSLKLRVVDDDDADGVAAGERDAAEARADLPPLVEPSSREADDVELRRAIAELGPVDAVGHRIVHGGTELREPMPVDDGVVEQLVALTDLAPLHQPACVAALRAARAALPDVPHVACFDTAFHATIPPAAATYALPRAWRERWPLRRFGFHGLSHAHAGRRAAELLDRPPEELRLVTAHLGAGASLAAIREGRSVDTTMGFTPLEGLVMATRSGSVDPGLVLWLQQEGGLPVEEIAAGLEHESGLQGLAGNADMRAVLAAAEAGERAALLARDVYVHRLRAEIAAMAAAMDGLDALVFTGGVGENAPVIRDLAVEGLGFLGVSIDADRNNARGAGDRFVSESGGAASVLVVESREDLEIARQVRATLAAGW